MLNKVLTEEQIRENGKGVGKANQDPFIVRGGYRCRHTWIPTVDEIVDEPPPEPEGNYTHIFEPINREGITENYKTHIS